jgi:formylglycine-generating enzyme required for sulfatase activity
MELTMRFAAAFHCAVLLIFLGIVAGYAEKRVAPMIGNGVHRQGAQLPAPAGHAGASAAMVSREIIRRRGDGPNATLPLGLLEELKKVAQASPSPAAPCGGAEAVSASSLSARSAMPLCAAEERSLKPMDTFVECDKCPGMIVVPAGSFTMGSPRNEPEKSFDEGPQHQVTIGKAFAVGKFAVTFNEWDACVADGGCNGYRPLDEGWGRGRRPVIGVSWNDAKAYVAWLSRKTGKGYRLLSEAEREYATRAGTATPFWWGSSITPRQANYDGDFAYNKGAKGEDRQKTLPVDSFEPNPWGLYQVHGNVWEWAEDCWHNSYLGAPTDGAAWTNATKDCTSRVLRGGSWFNLPRDLRSAARVRTATFYRSRLDGFRVGRTLLSAY